MLIKPQARTRRILLDFLISTPAVFAASIAAFAAILTATATLFINRRLQLIDLDLKRSTAAIAKQTADIAAKQADLKESELRAAAAFRASDTLLKRHEALRNDVCSLLTLLDLNRLSPGPIQGEVRKEIVTKCNSISLFVSPRRKFDETLNVQLDHVTAFLDEGEGYWRHRPGFFAAFRLNCWNLIDAEFDRIRDTIQKGELVARRQPEARTFV